MSTAAELLGGERVPATIQDHLKEAIDQLRVALHALETPGDFTKEELQNVIHDCDETIREYDMWVLDVDSKVLAAINAMSFGGEPDGQDSRSH